MGPHRKSEVRRLIRSAVLVLTACAVTGCVAHGRVMPEVKGRLALKVTNEQPSPLLLPFGFYQIPDTSVYVSGHQGAAGVGVLFGIIGGAVASAAAKATGARKTKDFEAQLRLDIPKITERALAEELGRRVGVGRFATADASGDGSLEIMPYLVVTFIGNDQVRPWVVLRTKLKDLGGRTKWAQQYIAGVGEVRQLGGEEGWASNDGAPLRAAVDRNLRLAIDVVLRDASGALPRATARSVKVEGNWVWAKEPKEAVTQVLDETEEILVVYYKPSAFAGQSIFAEGVNILDKKAVTVTAEPK